MPYPLCPEPYALCPRLMPCALAEEELKRGEIRMKIIDSHAHISAPQVIREFPEGSWRQDLVPKEGTRALRKSSLKAHLERIDIGIISEDMKQMGVDLLAISPPPSLFFYEESPDRGLRAAQIQNDVIAGLSKEHPDRFVGLAVVPLQDVPRAVGELKRAVNDLGLRGVAIGSSVQGVHMGNPSFVPFWEAVADMDLFVFIHPTFVRTYDIKTLAPYHLHNLFGNPMETGLAAADLVFSGIFERQPGLKIMLAHGGGVMPWLKGRWVHGYNMRPEPKTHLRGSPIESINKFYVDTIIHDPRALLYLVESFGADHILLGSDFPAPMGPEFPVKEVEEIDIPREDKIKILGGNAARLMRLNL